MEAKYYEEVRDIRLELLQVLRLLEEDDCEQSPCQCCNDTISNPRDQGDEEEKKEEVHQEEEVHEEGKVLEDGEDPDPEAEISVSDDLLRQAIEESNAMAEPDDDLRYVGSSKGSWVLDPKLNPKFQVTKIVIGTNFADFTPWFRLIMREARVNASMQRMFLAQSLPDAMAHQFLDLREDQRTLDEILDYFSALFKVESAGDIETQLRNIRQDESETVVTFHSR